MKFKKGDKVCFDVQKNYDLLFLKSQIPNFKKTNYYTIKSILKKRKLYRLTPNISHQLWSEDWFKKANLVIIKEKLGVK